MAFFGVLLTLLAVCCRAQLLVDSIDKLKELAVATPPSFEASPGFVNPGICDSSVNQTAGYINAGNPDYFFWLFESKSNPATDPLIMWLSGGPGCSSQLALLFENGPCTVSNDGSVVANPYSWHNKANVMWVDQPAGVGFSTSGSGSRDEEGVAKNMYTFLQGFFKQFPQYQKTDFYIFGESYGGHYVPAIAHRVWQGNKASEGIHIPMVGIGIGNGLTNPTEQYKWYPEQGHDGGKAEGGHAPGVFSSGTYNVMKAAIPACVAQIKSCNNGNNVACYSAYESCNLVAQIPYKLTGKNPYDQRIPCETGNLCYDFSQITTFLNSESVQGALGVKGTWQSCNMAVNLAFVSAGDWMHNFSYVIPDLLHDGVRALIYAGDCDYICNWLGNKAWAKTLDWEHKDDFNNANDDDWELDGETVAKHRSAGGFHFMQVFNAGHMVPMDQPKAAMKMVQTFLDGSLPKSTLGSVTV